MGFIKKWNKLGLFTRIMVGFILGIAAGLIFGKNASCVAFLGTILTRLLTMVVAPLVLGLLICAAADVKDFKTLGKIGSKTLAIFLGSTAIAVAIGLFFANVMQIGAGFVMSTDIAYEAKEIPSVATTLMNIIPTNPFQSLSEQNLLQIIFFALLLGFALIKLGDKGAPVLNFFRAWTEAWKEITNIVLEFTPIGVFGLMADIVGKYGMDVLMPYLKTIIACYITCILFTVFVQGFLMVGAYGKVNPLKFFATMKEAMLFVFATCSSVATIPINLKCTKRLGVSDRVADFVIPFGAVMNMNGTAIYEAIAVIFASQVFGIHLTVTQQIMVMVTAVLASIGTAGIPGSGLVMLTIVLNAVNLPLETIGLLAGIDRILNMARVIPNIVGDAATAVVVAKNEGELHHIDTKALSAT
ncbi:MAG: dicarboxylate/amino acid:cation symporter [Ruminococcaceae bacterium]|nr:dicarboxylate/amino acid:cation symporter [Oscillospiraceae bacterium]